MDFSSETNYGRGVKGAYRWMVVGKSVIDTHVLEEPFYVLVEESLDFAVVELRVNKEGTNVGLHDVRESLNITSATTQ